MSFGSLKRLREGVADPAGETPIARRAAEIIRGVGTPSPLGPRAEARVLAALRAAAPGTRSTMRRLALQLGAFVGVAITGFGAYAGLTWYRAARQAPPAAAPAPAPRPVPSPRERAAPAPAPEQISVTARAPRASDEAPPAEVEPSDTPPRLLIDPHEAPYKLKVPPELARPGAAYVALVRVCVSEGGQVTSAVVQEGAHPRLDAQIPRTLARWRYTPALRDGKPVATCVPVRYRISVESGE